MSPDNIKVEFDLGGLFGEESTEGEEMFSKMHHITTESENTITIK